MSQSERSTPGKTSGTDSRQLRDLVSVGPRAVEDMHRLGVFEVSQLVGRDPDQLFEELQRAHGKTMDPCCHDVFRAAIAQAEDPALPAEKCRWWYWSAVRKAGR